MSLFAFLFAVMSSCGNRSDKGVRIISGGDALKMDFEELFTDFDIQPVICSEPVDAEWAYVYGDEMFFIDNRNEVLWYFKNHQFVSKLSAKGRGPGEYDLISYMAYSPDTHILYVAPDSKECILQYDVPSMRYIGNTPTTWYTRSFSLLNDSTFITVRQADGAYDFAKVDIRTGNAEKLFDITPSESPARITDVGHNPFEAIVGLCDYNYRIGTLDAEGNLLIMDCLRFSDGIPKDIAALRNSMNIEGNLRYTVYKYSTHYYSDILFPVRLDGGYSFWYNNFLPDAETVAKLQFYARNSGREINASDITIPGLSLLTDPYGVTDDGRLFIVIEEPLDMIVDPDTEPSPLANRIIDAVSAQKDENPVILYFRVRPF